MANMIALRPLERGVSGLVRTRGQSALFSAGGLRGGPACVLLENGEVLVEPLRVCCTGLQGSIQWQGNARMAGAAVSSGGRIVLAAATGRLSLDQVCRRIQEGMRVRGLEGFPPEEISGREAQVPGAEDGGPEARELHRPREIEKAAVAFKPQAEYKPVMVNTRAQEAEAQKPRRDSETPPPAEQMEERRTAPRIVELEEEPEYREINVFPIQTPAPEADGEREIEMEPESVEELLEEARLEEEQLIAGVAEAELESRGPDTAAEEDAEPYDHHSAVQGLEGPYDRLAAVAELDPMDSDFIQHMPPPMPVNMEWMGGMRQEEVQPEEELPQEVEKEAEQPEEKPLCAKEAALNPEKREAFLREEAQRQRERHQRAELHNPEVGGRAEPQPSPEIPGDGEPGESCPFCEGRERQENAAALAGLMQELGGAVRPDPDEREKYVFHPQEAWEREYYRKSLREGENHHEQLAACIRGRPDGLFINAFPQEYPRVAWRVYQQQGGSHCLHVHYDGRELYALPGPSAAFPPPGIPAGSRYAVARNRQGYWIFTKAGIN